MKVWNASLAVFVLALTAATALAEDKGGSGTAASPSIGTVCTRAYYCPKPLPCLPCPPTCGIRVPYCPKPLPCLGCPPKGGICAPYCPKPLPCLSCPVVSPQCCPPHYLPMPRPAQAVK